MHEKPNETHPDFAGWFYFTTPIFFSSRAVLQAAVVMRGRLVALGAAQGVSAQAELTNFPGLGQDVTCQDKENPTIFHCEGGTRILKPDRT